jgi:hypothetical protein
MYIATGQIPTCRAAPPTSHHIDLVAADKAIPTTTDTGRATAAARIHRFSASSQKRRIVSNNPGCCVCGKSNKDKSRAMQKSTQQPSHDYERNADDCKHPVEARRGWRLRASTEGRRDFRLPALPHADDHQQDNHSDGTKKHHNRHRNQSMGPLQPPRYSPFGLMLQRIVPRS